MFVTSEEPALHCIDAKTGTAIRQVPHVIQFAATSKDRVYGVDDLGGLVAPGCGERHHKNCAHNLTIFLLSLQVPICT